jgi:hypothetical protein
MTTILLLGSAGYQPAAFGNLAEYKFVGGNYNGCGKPVRGKLPRTAGWQPAFPKSK